MVYFSLVYFYFFYLKTSVFSLNFILFFYHFDSLIFMPSPLWRFSFFLLITIIFISIMIISFIIILVRCEKSPVHECQFYQNILGLLNFLLYIFYIHIFIYFKDALMFIFLFNNLIAIFLIQSKNCFKILPNGVQDK